MIDIRGQPHRFIMNPQEAPNVQLMKVFQCCQRGWRVMSIRKMTSPGDSTANCKRSFPPPTASQVGPYAISAPPDCCMTTESLHLHGGPFVTTVKSKFFTFPLSLPHHVPSPPPPPPPIQYPLHTCIKST